MIKPSWKILVAGILLLLSSCVLLQSPPSNSIHLTLGNPSNATASVSNSDNYLMVKPQYALSYNNSSRIPNWVSWQLNQSWLGTVPRRNDFRPDDRLPQNWYHVVLSDYSGSGYDRGHMAPSGDRTNNIENNSATFLMTNILPQAPDNNQGPWAELENYCRDLAKQGKELYIISGGYGKRRPLARSQVIPPQHLWKMIVVLDQPLQRVQDITNQTRVIAVDLPNVQGIRETDWRTFRVSVAQLEAATGYNFLSNVPEAVQKVLEGKVDRE